MAVLFAALAALLGVGLIARILLSFSRLRPAQRLPLFACAGAWFAGAAAIYLGARKLWPGSTFAAACALTGFGIWLRHIWSQSLNNTTM